MDAVFIQLDLISIYESIIYIDNLHRLHYIRTLYWSRLKMDRFVVLFLVYLLWIVSIINWQNKFCILLLIKFASNRIRRLKMHWCFINILSVCIFIQVYIYIGIFIYLYKFVFIYIIIILYNDNNILYMWLYTCIRIHTDKGLQTT